MLSGAEDTTWQEYSSRCLKVAFNQHQPKVGSANSLCEMWFSGDKLRRWHLKPQQAAQQILSHHPAGAGMEYESSAVW